MNWIVVIVGVEQGTFLVLQGQRPPRRSATHRDSTPTGQFDTGNFPFAFFIGGDCLAGRMNDDGDGGDGGEATVLGDEHLCLPCDARGAVASGFGLRCGGGSWGVCS